jgi:hypothetical protein
MSDTPTPEPETQRADLSALLLRAIRDPGVVLGESRPPEQHLTHFQNRAVMYELLEGGWIVPGVPPVNQVLADARQFSDELVLTKLVARIFRTLILGGLVIPETPQAMTWMRTYIDGDDRRHGPLGKPMVWPDALPTVTRLLRDWGFQPTPTVPPYVSLRPGGPLTRSAPDPTAPDPAMVAPVAKCRESSMGGLLDETAGAIGVLAVDRMTAIRAMSAAFDRGVTHFDVTPILGAITNLRDHQQQADEGGERVTVSRQALDEVITHLSADDTFIGGVDVDQVREALEPFAKAAAQIRDDEEGDEWMKVRLTVADYREARDAFVGLGGVLG